MSQRQKRIGKVNGEDALHLFIDWFWHLLSQKHGIQQTGYAGDAWTFSVQGSCVYKILHNRSNGEVMLDVPESVFPDAEQVAMEAARRASAVDVGDPTWWVTGFESKGNLDESSQLHMMRSVGQHKQFPGKWKLGNDAVVSFNEREFNHLPVLPKQEVKIVFRSNGPGHGPFGHAAACKNATLIRATLSFVTGTPLEGLPGIFPAKAQEREEAERELEAGALPEIHLLGLHVWPAIARLLAGREAFDRVLGALLAYEHALTQKSGNASLVFFVTAIEALIVPNTVWSKERVTKRFCEFLVTACPETLREVLAHANFREAFGEIEKPKEFVEKLYQLRSRPIHTGHLGMFRDILNADPDSVRVALVGDVTRDAILAFLRQPFSSLWGHPKLDPFVRIQFSAEEHEGLCKRAGIKASELPEWIRRLVLRR